MAFALRRPIRATMRRSFGSSTSVSGNAKAEHQMDKLKYKIKAAKIAKRLKKAQRDFKRGDKRAQERIAHHEQQQVLHKLTDR